MIPETEVGEFIPCAPTVFKYRKIFSTVHSASEFFNKLPDVDARLDGCIVYWNDPVEQEPEVSQEEKKWTDEDMKNAFKDGFTNWGNEKWETTDEWFNNYIITRKTTPQ